jgi:hypothetical protein
MKSKNNNNNDDDDDDDNNNNTAMGSVHARGDTLLTFGLKALTETNTSLLATGLSPCSREPASTHRESNESNPNQPGFREIHFNIILPSMPIFSE